MKSTLNSNCSCHILAPCGYCEKIFECENCKELRHPEDRGSELYKGMLLCTECFEKTTD